MNLAGKPAACMLTFAEKLANKKKAEEKTYLSMYLNGKEGKAVNQLGRWPSDQ